MNDSAHDKLLTPGDVAEMLGVTERTLQDWRLKKQGPKAVFLSARTIRYRLDEVKRWIDERAQEGAST